MSAPEHNIEVVQLPAAARVGASTFFHVTPRDQEKDALVLAKVDWQQRGVLKLALPVNKPSLLPNIPSRKRRACVLVRKGGLRGGGGGGGARGGLDTKQVNCHKLAVNESYLPSPDLAGADTEADEDELGSTSPGIPCRSVVGSFQPRTQAGIWSEEGVAR